MLGILYLHLILYIKLNCFKNTIDWIYKNAIFPFALKGGLENCTITIIYIGIIFKTYIRPINK